MPKLFCLNICQVSALYSFCLRNILFDCPIITSWDLLGLQETKRILIYVLCLNLTGMILLHQCGNETVKKKKIKHHLISYLQVNDKLFICIILFTDTNRALLP